MKFQKIISSIVSVILSIGLLFIVGCEPEGPVQPTLDGLWEMKKITSTEGDIITEEIWGSVFWDFDLETEEVEILIDYSILLENIENNGGSENYPNGVFHGLTDGTYELNVSSVNSKNKIQIGNSTNGSFVLDDNDLILNLNYENEEISATEIYYFEKEF